MLGLYRVVRFRHAVTGCVFTAHIDVHVLQMLVIIQTLNNTESCIKLNLK
jgi:hypothetical protein